MTDAAYDERLAQIRAGQAEHRARHAADARDRIATLRAVAPPPPEGMTPGEQVMAWHAQARRLAAGEVVAAADFVPPPPVTAGVWITSTEDRHEVLGVRPRPIQGLVIGRDAEHGWRVVESFQRKPQFWWIKPEHVDWSIYEGTIRPDIVAATVAVLHRDAAEHPSHEDRDLAAIVRLNSVLRNPAGAEEP